MNALASRRVLNVFRLDGHKAIGPRMKAESVSPLTTSLLTVPLLTWYAIIGKFLWWKQERMNEEAALAQCQGRSDSFTEWTLQSGRYRVEVPRRNSRRSSVAIERAVWRPFFDSFTVIPPAMFTSRIPVFAPP
jgi:hypothetical protein